MYRARLLTILLCSVTLMPALGNLLYGQTSCSQFATIPVAGGAYNVQTDEWNSTAPQCITASGTGFTVTQANFTLASNGNPNGYPSIYVGCHWGVCTTNNPLPLQVSQIGTANSSLSITTAPGEWDAAYDIWFNTTPTTNGQPNGTELMIWINNTTPPYPGGSQVGTANIDGATWQVWTANPGWHLITYVLSSPSTSVNLNLKPFFSDAIVRGQLQSAWWLISVEAGFEIWTKGQGLAVNSYSVSVAPGSNTKGDFNADSHPDIVWQNDSTGQVTVNYLDGSLGTTLLGWNWLNTANNTGWRVVGAADFDGNGVPDLVWQNNSTGQVTVNFYGGTGGASLTGWAWLNTADNAGWTVVGVGDFDGNGVPDLVWENSSTRQVTVNYYGYVNGQLAITGWNWLNSVSNPGWHVAGAVDMDGNGVPDLLWQNDSNGTATVNYYAMNNGQPAITGWSWINTGGAAGWTLLGASDLDGNGVPDTIWQNNSTRQVSVNYYSFTNGQPVMTGWAWLQPNNTPGWHAVVPR